jgi:hypothetical protein
VIESGWGLGGGAQGSQLARRVAPTWSQGKPHPFPTLAAPSVPHGWPIPAPWMGHLKAGMAQGWRTHCPSMAQYGWRKGTPAARAGWPQPAAQGSQAAPFPGLPGGRRRAEIRTHAAILEARILLTSPPSEAGANLWDSRAQAERQWACRKAARSVSSNHSCSRGAATARHC